MRFTDNFGFSLAELLIAVALMSLIAAIALPGWNRLVPAFQLESATRQLQSELHSIKMRAAAENTSFQLSYAEGASSYSLQSAPSFTLTKPLSDGITIIKAGSVAFSPRGTASANRLRLKNQAGECRQVVVSPTGRVRICKPTSCTTDC
jgi:prepilin-type N-terminal cleavage/methylation domain-containing protein